MNSAADLGGIWIVLNLTTLAFAQIKEKGKAGPCETDWIVISSEEVTCPASSFILSVML